MSKLSNIKGLNIDPSNDSATWFSINTSSLLMRLNILKITFLPKKIPMNEANASLALLYIAAIMDQKLQYGEITVVEYL
jgi:hypothetical protein